MTSRQTIGGVLDYEVLARLNRPRDTDAIRAAIHELASRGMGDYEIASACELAVEQVRRVLGERTCGEIAP